MRCGSGKIPALSKRKRPHGQTHQVLCSDGLPTAAGPHHHTCQPGLHVLQTICQGQDGHDLTGHCDVEPCLEYFFKKGEIVYNTKNGLKVTGREEDYQNIRTQC